MGIMRWSNTLLLLVPMWMCRCDTPILTPTIAELHDMQQLSRPVWFQKRKLAVCMHVARKHCMYFMGAIRLPVQALQNAEAWTSCLVAAAKGFTMFVQNMHTYLQ